MKARINLMRELSKNEKRRLRDCLLMDMDTYLAAKKRTMADRIIALCLMAARDEFGLGAKRVRRLYEHLITEMKTQAENMHLTSDAMFFSDLRSIGLDDLVEEIQADYAAEFEACRGTIFDSSDEDEENA